MISAEAYSIICGYIASHDNFVLVHSEYDSINFGNFAIQVVISGEYKLIVCDRDQVSICTDPEGIDDCHVMIQSLRDVSSEDLLDTLKIN